MNRRRCQHAPLAQGLRIEWRSSKKDRTHDESMAELFNQGPGYTLELRNSILEDGEQGELLIALRQIGCVLGKKIAPPCLIE
jgi:hypothetical protein